MIIEEPSKKIIGQGNLRGNNRAVFGYLRILAETKLPEADNNWWACRAYILASDKDRQCGDLPLLAGLLLREN